MANANDYYFSTPVLDEDTCLNLSIPTVIVTQKDIWDQKNKLDYYDLDNQEYTELYKILKVPNVMEEAMENFFQPKKSMTCRELEKYLQQEGFTHNPALDSLMDDFLALGK